MRANRPHESEAMCVSILSTGPMACPISLRAISSKNSIGNFENLTHTATDEHLVMDGLK